jgi:hypothetical protein
MLFPEPSAQVLKVKPSPISKKRSMKHFGLKAFSYESKLVYLVTVLI